MATFEVNYWPKTAHNGELLPALLRNSATTEHILRWKSRRRNSERDDSQHHWSLGKCLLRFVAVNFLV